MRFLILIFLTFSTIYANSLELDGIVESQNEKIISSKMMGYITKIYVNEGDSVKRVKFYTKLTQQIFCTRVIF